MMLLLFVDLVFAAANLHPLLLVLLLPCAHFPGLNELPMMTINHFDETIGCSFFTKLALNPSFMNSDGWK